MTNLKIPLSLPLVLLATLALVFAGTTPVHAQFTGVVCIADGSSTNCPSTPPNFTGSTGSQLTVAVNIQGSDSFNGYDIRVKTDPTVLNPVSVDTETNSILQQNSASGLFWFGCIDGTPTNASSNGCNSSLDTAGVVHVVAVALGGQTPSPSTGHVFSITYSIVSGSGTTSIGFPVAPAGNTACSPSSVSGTNTCVQVVLQSTVDPETVQAAGFNQGPPPPPPDFTISASPTSLTLKGETSGTSTITITSLNGFNGPVTLSASVTPVVKNGLTASLNPTSVNVPANQQATSTLTATARGATPKGSYTITVTATGGGITKQATVNVTVTAG